MPRKRGQRSAEAQARRAQRGTDCRERLVEEHRRAAEEGAAGSTALQGSAGSTAPRVASPARQGTSSPRTKADGVKAENVKRETPDKDDKDDKDEKDKKEKRREKRAKVIVIDPDDI